MRHLKDTVKLGITTSHKRCMIANMLKSLINQESITTTVPKAKELRRHADRIITLAKQNDLASRRRAIAKLMIRFNALTPKEARDARAGDTKAYNEDRLVIEKLFNVLGTRYTNRAGGYTRIVKAGHRKGDNTQQCIVEFLPE